MGKTLIIVESPAKAKTIGRYLGDEYSISASVGHVRDLPASTIGVDIKNDFKPRYITMKGKEKVLRELKVAAEKSDRVLLATDPDREGEAIAWHLATALKVDPDTPCRIAFNEITENAVRKSVDSPRAIDMDLVNAQQARRILDRLVGYELSPLLWKKIRKGLSAGRVQSVATRMTVEREREIRAFIPEEYWLLTAYLKTEPESAVFRARYHGELDGAKVRKQALKNQEQVQDLLQDLKDKTYSVHTLKKGTRKRQPNAPFTTSTLQQEASRYLNFSARRTMRVAQQLYEGLDLPGHGATALVTYIRTDSVRISPVALEEARKLILTRYGENYLPPKARLFRNRNAAQDAHEAIRPAHFDLPPDRVEGALSREQYQLYKLIWDKFIASQMAAAVLDTVSADIKAGTHIFRVKGETIRFPGWMAQYGHTAQTKEDEKGDELTDEQIPELVDDQTLILDKLTPEQKFTKPPARYTEASLIRELEKQGIGRPSTYAPTISTILDRMYVEKDNRWLVPTDLGFLVTEMLEDNFQNIVDPTFTAGMEAELDEVETGDLIGGYAKALPGFS